MNDDESFVLLLTDKSNNEMHEFEGPSYSAVVAKFENVTDWLLGTPA